MLLVGLVAVLSFALVTGLIVRIGFQTVVDRADRQNAEQLSAEIGQRLGALRVSDSDAEFEARVAQALNGLPVKTEVLAVTDGSGKIIYTSKRDRAEKERQRESVLKQLRRVTWTRVATSDSEPLLYAFKMVHIDTMESNQTIIAAVGQIAAWAAAIAIVVAVVVSFLVSRPISEQARTLSRALSEMQAGRRDVELPIRGAKEMREIAASAAELQEALRREEELRKQWAADVAHDLRTPLTVLKGQLEGMIDGVLPSDRARLERNYEEVRKLERLVNQLADLTRIESPGFKIELKAVEAASILAGQAQRFAKTAAAQRIKITVGGDAIPAAPIQADSGLLERALANLVDNAIRYGDPDSELFLRAERRGPDRLAFVVDNSGLVDPQDRPRVFDRLYRGDRSRSTQGSGIGLSIALAIAQAHGGSLSLACDDANRRTRFELTISSVDIRLSMAARQSE